MPDETEQIGSIFADLEVKSGAQSVDFVVTELAAHETSGSAVKIMRTNQ